MAKQRGIYKRGNLWWICFKNHDGKIIRKSSGTSKHIEAVSIRNDEVKKADDIVKGKVEPDKKIEDYTFNQLADTYIDFITGRQDSAQIKTYVINAVFKPEFGDRLLRTFDLEAAEQLQKKLRTERRLAEGGTDKYISIFKAMFSYAGEHELVTDAVVKKVHKVGMFNPEGRSEFLTLQEASDLISVCPSHLQPIVVIALHTGMRKGEILKLVWSQVDLEHGFILLSANENKRTKKSATKTRRKREIPIDSTLRALFQSIPRHFTGEGENRKLVPYVFHDPKNFKPYGDVKNSWHTALKNTRIMERIEDFRFHDLRHTFASQYIMNGGSLANLQSILGHSNIKQTMRYAHLSREHKLEATSIMDRMPGAVTRKAEEISGENIAQEFTSQLLHTQTERGLTVSANPL